jgi:hypothetical protein
MKEKYANTNTSLMFIIFLPLLYFKKKKSIDQDLLVQPAAVVEEVGVEESMVGIILNEGEKEEEGVDLKTRRRHDVKMIGDVRR